MFKGFPLAKSRISRALSSNGQQTAATAQLSKDAQESSESGSWEYKPVKVKIAKPGYIDLSRFLADGEHVVGARRNTRSIQCWRVKDGSEVEPPMKWDLIGDAVQCIAVSQDGKWIAAGTKSSELVLVWDAGSHQKAKEIKTHSTQRAMDFSPDGTKIATGSDGVAHIWSFWSGQQLLKLMLENNLTSEAVKFSPDSSLLATSSRYDRFLCIHDARTDGRLVASFKHGTASIAWTSDSKQLFVTKDNDILCLDVSSGTTLSEWAIPTEPHDKLATISLSNNGTFIAACMKSSVSLWDVSTRKQIGSIILGARDQISLGISLYDVLLTLLDNEEIASTNLRGILPWEYLSRYSTITKPQRTAESRLDETVDGLRATGSHRLARQKEESPDEIIKSPRTDSAMQRTMSGQKITDLEKTIQNLRAQLADVKGRTKQKEDNLTKTTAALSIQNEKSSALEKIVEELRSELASSKLIIHAYQRKHQCEILYADGHVMAAAKTFLDIAGDSLISDAIIQDWILDFRNKCIIALERIGDEALSTEKHEAALSAYATALFLGPSSPNDLLTKWASAMLFRGSVNEVVDGANEFKLPRYLIYRAICDALEGYGRVAEAVDFLRQMQGEPSLDGNVDNKQPQWELDFRSRCVERLEKLLDVALGSQSYSEADEYLSIMLSFDPPNRMGILTRRSETRAMMRSWEDALKDADEMIKLDPSFYGGYEQEHMALHGAGRYAEAVAAFDTMLEKLEESPGRELRSRYTDARPTICDIVNTTVSSLPEVLIDTSTGQLLDKTEQEGAFESLPIFHELVSSMTTRVDDARIWREVKKYYRYVMFSHRWQANEPRYKEVKNATVYKLKLSSGSVKLQTFCTLVRDLGFQWAWCDTCCIDQENNVVLQESLVAMFTWYRGSSLTIVYLFDVLSPDGLRRCIWNTRAWTYQEYVAAEAVQFYMQDWKPYLGLTIWNHKESPVVISEMEQASQASADRLVVLHPGLDRVREKLYMASLRRSTRIEDIAYSLLGIFNVSIPVIYGEGTRAVGRFLEHILTGSGDVTILAWTGIANPYNSCLPLNLTVYNPLVPLHVPQMETAELDQRVTELRSSLPDLSLSITLYDQLHRLPSATIASTRLQLPCIRFPITKLVCTSGPVPRTTLRTYLATTALLGEIEITTTSGLSVESEHCLVHPWIRPLLSQEYARGIALLDKASRAVRLVARLKQQFGALLFENVSWVDYKRVAADSLIMVQVRDDVSLTDLMNVVDTIEVQ